MLSKVEDVIKQIVLLEDGSVYTAQFLCFMESEKLVGRYGLHWRLAEGFNFHRRG